MACMLWQRQNDQFLSCRQLNGFSPGDIEKYSGGLVKNQRNEVNKVSGGFPGAPNPKILHPSIFSRPLTLMLNNDFRGLFLLLCIVFKTVDMSNAVSCLISGVLLG